jgi:hypothetical protein
MNSSRAASEQGTVIPEEDKIINFVDPWFDEYFEKFQQ